MGESMGESKDAPLFTPLSADADDAAPIEMESVCPACEENGTTKILLTKIPFYREVILMSFECPHCGNRNNELQAGASVAEHGISLRLAVTQPEDLNRTVVKSEYAAVSLPELDLTVPHKSQPGEVTTVEGVLTRVARGLGQDQARRREAEPAAADAIQAFLLRLADLLALRTPFHLVLDDPSGNSFIEPRNEPSKPDPGLVTSHFPRTLEHRKLLGLADDDEVEDDSGEDNLEEDWEKEVMRFQVKCPACGADAEDGMKVVDIPGFKETVVMGTNCEECGYRSSEIAVPDLELEGGRGVMSGCFTTVEGILDAIGKELTEGPGAFLMGDSADPERKERMTSFLGRLEDCKCGRHSFTLVIDDPAGNSYIQSLDGTEADSQLEKVWYDRTYEQNDDLGLNDINTDHYQDNDDCNAEADTGNS